MLERLLMRYALEMLKRRLLEEKLAGLQGGIYHKVQIELAFNSNYIEGSQLTQEQIRYIFETNTIGFENHTSLKVDDIIVTSNHFEAVDFLIDTSEEPLTESWIKTVHAILARGTSVSRKAWFAIGAYKLLPNGIAGRKTSLPEDVASDMEQLLEKYHALSEVTFEDLLDFHVRFERIHPFQDGNGRVGRLILFKECLKHKQIPFIFSAKTKHFYYRGLSEWDRQNGLLLDTCLAAQDKFTTYMDYFRIEY